MYCGLDKFPTKKKNSYGKEPSGEGEGEVSLRGCFHPCNYASIPYNQVAPRVRKEKVICQVLEGD